MKLTGRQKGMLMAVSVLLGLFAVNYCVAAYQTAYDKADNRITPGNVSTEIIEDFPSPTPISPDENTEIDKKIFVANTAHESADYSKDCYVRVSLGYSNSDIGKAVSLKNFDKDSWLYSDDGFYYYTKVLHEGESTTPLCTGFYVDSSKLKAEELKKLDSFEIQVYQESIESDVSGDFKDAWKCYAVQ